ncbi:unnamed protein product [Rotaria magnacalcarata]
MCMHVSNLVQLSSIILYLLVILGKLYENNDLNINSFINFSSYIAVIGILIQYMREFPTIIAEKSIYSLYFKKMDSINTLSNTRNITYFYSTVGIG